MTTSRLAVLILLVSAPACGNESPGSFRVEFRLDKGEGVRIRTEMSFAPTTLPLSNTADDSATQEALHSVLELRCVSPESNEGHQLGVRYRAAKGASVVAGSVTLRRSGRMDRFVPSFPRGGTPEEEIQFTQVLSPIATGIIPRVRGRARVGTRIDIREVLSPSDLKALAAAPAVEGFELDGYLEPTRLDQVGGRKIVEWRFSCRATFTTRIAPHRGTRLIVVVEGTTRQYTDSGMPLGVGSYRAWISSAEEDGGSARGSSLEWTMVYEPL